MKINKFIIQKNHNHISFKLQYKTVKQMPNFLNDMRVLNDHPIGGYKCLIKVHYECLDVNNRLSKVLVETFSLEKRRLGRF